MSFSTESPFVGPVPSTVQLLNAPLTAVLVQIRFPDVLSIAKAEFIADFQESIRMNYPFNQEHHNSVLELMDGNFKQTKVTNWRFFDKERQWRISLASNFLALETRAYKSRTEFTQRTVDVMHALSSTINPNLMTRIGVRYVNQLYGPKWEQLSRYIRPEVLGISIEEHQEKLSRTLNEIAGETDVGLMTSRWGFMPANQTHEPDLMPQISTPSWFLDIDVYNDFAQPESFDVKEIESRVMRLAARAYGFFRWTVNDEFLISCGGDI